MSAPSGGNPFAKGGAQAYLLDAIFNCNSWQAREPALRLFGKIVGNIVANPGEAKYRKLNVEKVMSKFGPEFRGMDQLMRRLGFSMVEGSLVLPADAPLEPLSQSLEAWRAREELLAAGRAEALRRVQQNMASVNADKAQRDAARDLVLREQRQARLAAAQRPVTSSVGNQLAFGATVKSAPPPPPPAKGG